MTTALSVTDISLSYGDLQVVWDVSLRANAGEVCAILGRNGAGKSTLCAGIAGALRANSGTVSLFGEDISSMSAWDRSRRGLAFVPEGKRIFRGLTVRDNLLVGLDHRRRRRTARVERIEHVCSIFPGLRDRLDEPGGRLSGGQQQMVALGQALIGNPRVLIIDEPSSGLAPVVVDEILGAIGVLKLQGVAIVLVEHLELAAAIADTVVGIEQGRVAATSSVDGVDLTALARRVYLSESTTSTFGGI